MTPWRKGEGLSSWSKAMPTLCFLFFKLTRTFDVEHYNDPCCIWNAPYTCVQKLNPLWDTTTWMAPQSSGHGHFDIPLPLISLGHFVVMSKCPWTRPDLGAENEVHEVVGHWHRKKIEHLYFLITYLSHSDTISLTHVLTNTRTRTQTHRAASMLNFCVCVHVCFCLLCMSFRVPV